MYSIKNTHIFEIPKPEREIIECNDLSNLFNYNWLSNNIPWWNHDSKIGFIKFEEVKTGFYLVGYGDKTDLEEFEFDSVEIYSLHTFFGNEYDYRFYKDNMNVKTTNGLLNVSNDKKDLINKQIKETEREVGRMQKKLNKLKELNNEQPR
jgi:hypothetical protein